MRRTMQINIDKKTGIFTGIIVVLLAIILSMSTSRNDERGFFGMHGFGMMGSDYNQRSSDLSGADIMFLQMMIPYHQQAVDISNLALAKSKDAELLFDLLWLEGMTNHHDGLFVLSDLRKTSLAALKELHGMGPNTIRVLVAEMKKADLSFRK